MAVVAVIKYTGKPDALVWKFPSAGFGTWTKLTVDKSQEAFLVKGGQVLDAFAPGEYVLSPENIPLLNGILNLPPKGKSELAADLWYINKGNSFEVKWGTPAPIELLDPKYKALIPVKSLGKFSIQIDNPSKFLSNLIQTIPNLNNDSIVVHLRNMHLKMFGENILSYIEDKDISLLEINPHLAEISAHLKDKFVPVLNELGIELNDFGLNHIKPSEDCPIVRQINDAKAKKAVSELVGSDYYVQEQPLAPSVAAAALSASASTQNVEEPIFVAPAPKICPMCYYDLEPGVRFCRECNYDTTPEVPQEDSKEQESTANKVRICSGCNGEMDAKARFCPACGTKQEEM